MQHEELTKKIFGVCFDFGRPKLELKKPHRKVSPFLFILCILFHSSMHRPGLLRTYVEERIEEKSHEQVP